MQSRLETAMNRPVQQPSSTSAASRMCGASRSSAGCIDNIIRANGIDWDQPRSLYITRPVRHRGQRRLRRHPRAGEEDGRHRPGLRGGGAPPRGQGQCRRGGRPQGHRARQLSSWRRCIGARRNGPTTRTTRPTSPTTTRSASATPNTPRSPTITSRRCGCRSRTRRSRPGSICRRTTRAARCRW